MTAAPMRLVMKRARLRRVVEEWARRSRENDNHADVGNVRASDRRKRPVQVGLHASEDGGGEQLERVRQRHCLEPHAPIAREPPAELRG